MTRKDYQLIANVLRAVYESMKDEHFDAIQAVTARMANMLQEDNPRFDRGKFYDAVYGKGWR